MWDISIQDPSPLPHNPHNPTTIAIPHRRTRCPGSYPLAIQQTGPDHHTGFIGPESHRVNTKESPLPLTPTSVRRPWGLAECSPSSLGFLSQCHWLARPGSLESSPDPRVRLSLEGVVGSGPAGTAQDWAGFTQRRTFLASGISRGSILVGSQSLPGQGSCQ